MRVRHSARCTLAMAVLFVAGLSACGHDQGPSQFNPSGMTTDLTTAQNAFNSTATASFDAAGAEISATLGAAAGPVVVTPKMAMLHPTAAQSFAQRITRLLPKASRISASMAAIPDAYLGTTFVWDVDSATYVASTLSGAPANGVRFILYAIDPLTLQPAASLDEVGYVDVTDQSTETTLSTHVLVYGDGRTWLEYTVSGTGTASSGSVGVEGFATNGVDRVNYSLQNTIAQSSNGMVLTLDYSLTVPTRSLSVSYTATFGNIAPDQVAVTLDFTISGRNGDVRVSGTYGAAGGAFSVRVNGEVFATVTITNGAPVVESATGTALTADEEASLQAILQYYDGSLGTFDDLFVPVS
jgi:hypothetical protein